MARSLVVILGLVLLLIWLVPRPEAITQPPVDAVSVASDAAARTGLPYQVAQGLPEGWRSTVARHAPSTDSVITWQGGWTTPTGGFVGLKQAAAPTAKWLALATVNGRAPAPPADLVTLAGRTWSVLIDERGQTHLVERANAGDRPFVTVLSSVNGMADLEVFAPALVAAPAPR